MKNLFLLIFILPIAFQSNLGQSKREPKTKGPVSVNTSTNGSTISIFGFEDVSVTKDGVLAIVGRAPSGNILIRILENHIEVKRLPFAYIASKVFFINKLEGWLSDCKSLYKTGDGGDSWAKIPGIETDCMAKMAFVRSDKGWVVGKNNSINELNGASFEKVAQSEMPFGDIRRIQFINELTGWRSEWKYPDHKVFLKTRDGGDSWETLDLQVDRFVSDFIFLNESIGYAVADRLNRTDDGGATWKIVEGLKDRSVNRVFFLDEMTGWTLGDNVCRTLNAARTWKCTKLDLDDFGEKLAFVSEKTGWVVTNSKIFATTDGGATWKRLDPYELVKSPVDAREIPLQ